MQTTLRPLPSHIFTLSFYPSAACSEHNTTDVSRTQCRIQCRNPPRKDLSHASILMLRCSCIQTLQEISIWGMLQLDRAFTPAMHTCQWHIAFAPHNGISDLDGSPDLIPVIGKNSLAHSSSRYIAGRGWSPASQFWFVCFSFANKKSVLIPNLISVLQSPVSLSDLRSMALPCWAFAASTTLAVSWAHLLFPSRLAVVWLLKPRAIQLPKASPPWPVVTEAECLSITGLSPTPLMTSLPHGGKFKSIKRLQKRSCQAWVMINPNEVSTSEYPET